MLISSRVIFKVEGIKIERGIFVVADGIDGSGKGVVINSLKDFAFSKGKKIFDGLEHQRMYNEIPLYYSLIKNLDVFISAEPTFTWVGAAVRDEITAKLGERKHYKHNVHYSDLSVANAYSIDREILINRLTAPALLDGKDIFQERSFSTTVLYQANQEDGIPLEQIMALPGNQLAKEFRPDLLIIPLVDPIVGLQRALGRIKADNCRWETKDFQIEVDKRYRSDWFREYFEDLGTTVMYIDTNGTERETYDQSIAAFKDYLGKSGNLTKYI